MHNCAARAGQRALGALTNSQPAVRADGQVVRGDRWQPDDEGVPIGQTVCDLHEGWVAWDTGVGTKDRDMGSGARLVSTSGADDVKPHAGAGGQPGSPAGAMYRPGEGAGGAVGVNGCFWVHSVATDRATWPAIINTLVGDEVQVHQQPAVGGVGGDHLRRAAGGTVEGQVALSTCAPVVTPTRSTDSMPGIATWRDLGVGANVVVADRATDVLRHHLVIITSVRSLGRILGRGASRGRWR